jgi:class 3 adenylate cyclase
VLANLRKSIERGAPWPGAVLGGIVSLIVAFLFACGAPPVDRADLAAVDYFFRSRERVVASPELVLVKYDDNAVRLEGPPTRASWARVARALSHLGAKRVALDVSFPDQQTPETSLLAAVASWSGRIMVVYTFEAAFEGPKLPHADRILPVLDAEPAADAAAIAAQTGLEAAAIARDLPELRWYAIWKRVGTMLAEKPELTAGECAAQLLKSPDETVAKVISVAHTAHRTMNDLAWRRVPIRIEGMPRDVPGFGTVRLVPPALVKSLAGAGHANTPTRDSDGVLRRAPLLIATQHGPMVYMGLELAAQALEDEAHRSEFVVSPRVLTLRQLDRKTGAETRRVDFPLSGRGTSLSEWPAWPERQALPMLKLIEYDKARYDTRFDNLDATVKALGAEAYPHWEAFQKRWKEEVWSPEFDRILDETEAQAVRDLRGDAEALAKQAAEKRDQAGKAPPSRRPAFIKEAERLDGVAAERRKAADALGDHTRIAAQVRPLVEGRLCVVGNAATSLGDIWSTPLGEVPGMDLHGNVASMALDRTTLAYAARWVNLVYIALAGLAAALGVTWLGTMRAAGVAVVVAVLSIVLGVQIGQRAAVLLSGAGPLAAVAAAFTMGLGWRELVTRRSQRQLRKELERRYSPELVEMIVKEPELLQRPRKLAASIFFSDIKGFTSISEGMRPEQLVAYMNRYHDRMTQLLKQERAYVDKYIGDGIMALFGAPIEYPDHAISACRAALKNIEATKQLSGEFEREGLPPISIRIGLNSGEIVAAYVGAADRADYTAIADAVNLAARLEGANKFYATAIMAGEATYELAREKFWFRELDLIRVVGKKVGVKVYELIGERDGGVSRMGKEFQETYDAAISAFRGRHWSDAAALFSRCVELRPHDTPSNIHLGRVQGFVMNPPPDDWPGIFDLTSK